jgi:phosphatidate cytidylyltransferase
VTDLPPKKSDLGVRTASAVAMVVVAGTALWLGGWAWIALCGLVACGVLWEWRTLVRGFALGARGEAAWMVAGVIYIGLATAMLIVLRGPQESPLTVLQLVSMVVATDVGAYFAGRSIGGPKIASRISPSKTWAGLFGGILFATLVIALAKPIQVFSSCLNVADLCTHSVWEIAIWNLQPAAWWLGPIIAIIAQIGDFFESWMKRRAGVKDSGSLIPGHGGLFDRVDGLLAVLFVIGLFGLLTIATALISGEGLLPTPA